MADPRTKRFRYGAFALAAPALLCLGSATAWADESIVIDFVRHAETAANAAGIIDTDPPGDGLNAAGDQQAEIVAEALKQGAPYAGIYTSDETRAVDTADYLTQALGLSPNDVQTLPGLDEIDAGIYNGDPTDSLAGILYVLPPISWILGDEFVPIPGSTDPNGVAFDESFSSAVQTIYDNTVSGGGSSSTDVAFSSVGAITTWALMNVNNPDFSPFLTEFLETGQFLPNTGTVVVEGSPEQGWTLVSVDGQPVPQDPGLPTELFVDLRNLIEAPQFAAYNIYEAFLTDNPTTITNAIEAGISQITTATEQLPVSVFDDIVNALGGGTASGAADLGDLSGLVSTLATDLSGLL